MEYRKWMHHDFFLPMVVKVTRASCLLVTTPPKIASIGAASELHAMSPSFVTCFEGSKGGLLHLMRLYKAHSTLPPTGFALAGRRITLSIL